MRSKPDLPERMSRVAVYITAGFFAVIWPATLLLSTMFHCGSDCIQRHGQALVELAIGALITAPVAALSFISAGRLRRIAADASRPGRRRAGSLAAIVMLILFAGLTGLALFMWSYAGAVFLSQMSGMERVINSVAIAAVMAIYTAAVCGGSWMALIGARRLQEAAERERAARLEMFR